MVRLSVIISDDEMIIERLPNRRTEGIYWGAIAVTEAGGWSGDALAELFARLRQSGGAWDICSVEELEKVMMLMIRHLFRKSKAMQAELQLSVFDAGSLFWLRPIITECCQKLVREDEAFKELLFCWYLCSVERSLLPAEAATKSTLAVQVASRPGQPQQSQLSGFALGTAVETAAVVSKARERRRETWLLAGLVLSSVAFLATVSFFFY